MPQKTSQLMNVNDARRELFSKGNRSLENIPPTQAALVEHIKDMHFKLALYGVCVFSNFQISHILLTGGGRKMIKLGSLLGLLCLMCLKSAMSLSNAAVHSKRCSGNCKC